MLVYVGAVMTLFLFVVMMLDIDIESLRTHFIRYLPFGLILVALLVGLMLISMPEAWFQESVEKNIVVTNANIVQSIDDNRVAMKPLSNTEQIGMVLYTDYIYAFELAAAILLVAIIAAITLVHREVRSKTQNITKQIMTRREDRVRLISMKSEE